MDKFKLACFSLLFVAGVANAHVACNGFEIKIKNKTPDDFLMTKLELAGAQLQPNGVEKISAHTKQVFTVNNSSENVKMSGTMELHTISIPSKSVTIKFELQNKGLICFHDDKGSKGDYPITKIRLPNHVKYTVG